MSGRRSSDNLDVCGMHIDLLCDVPDVGRIVRLSEFTADEVQRLLAAVRRLANGEAACLDLSHFGVVDPGGAHWTFGYDKCDAGLLVTAPSLSWRLTRESWDN